MPFRTALSGLNAASSDLRVIGHNVANASTVGFKESRAEFADIFPASNLGVTANAVGSGVKVASVSQQFTQGNVTFTDNNLDLAISGQGFFRLNDNGVTVYSRAGQFGVDRDGYVVNNQGHRLTAYTSDANGNVTGAIDDLRLDTGDLPPRATSFISVGANLDSTEAPIAVGAVDPADPTTYNHSTSLTNYDSLGNPVLTTMYFQKQVGPPDNTWHAYGYMTPPGAAAPILVPPDNGGATDYVTMTFGTDGTLTSVDPNTGSGSVAAYSPVSPGTGANDITLNIAFSETTQFGSAFSVNSLTQDGFNTGRLSGVDIDESGIVTARYTNGQSVTLAQLALANFANPQGLRQLGETVWTETYGSGAALVGSPGSGSLGLVQSGALEGSNVDLTEQLVNMITAQRNFQANAQVITTADTITQTIINIR